MGWLPRFLLLRRHCAGELVAVASFLLEVLEEVPGCLLWEEEVEGDPCLRHQEGPGHLLGEGCTASGQVGGL